LFIRVAPSRISTEWYAVWYRDEKRHLAKIGSYPTTPLVDARKKFREDFAPSISARDEPDWPRTRKATGNTVTDLFEAYVKHLESEGKEVKGPRRFLLGASGAPTTRWKGRRVECAAEAIGATRAASSVTHKHIIPHLKAIHDRGSPVAASTARAFKSAAFSFAMQSTNTYHREAGDVDWNITINPVTAIRFNPDARVVGDRHLTPAEYRDFWWWLQSRLKTNMAAPVLLLCMATGQRLTEMLRLTSIGAVAQDYARIGVFLGVYDAAGQTIDWPKTKNGKAHTLPLAPIAASILDKWPVETSGLYFGRSRDASKVLTIGAAEYLIADYLKKFPMVQKFTPRDLRRTWKTLAGAAGLSKDIRDRLQNHAMTDVSSRHYDRYEYLAEKRDAVNAWSTYMERILSGDIDRPVSRLADGTVDDIVDVAGSA
jgi:integrase